MIWNLNHQGAAAVTELIRLNAMTEVCCRLDYLLTAESRVLSGADGADRAVAARLPLFVHLVVHGVAVRPVVAHVQLVPQAAREVH